MQADALNKIYAEQVDKELRLCLAKLGIPYEEGKEKMGCLYDQKNPQHREYWYVDEAKEINRLLFIADVTWLLGPKDVGKGRLRIEIVNLVLDKVVTHETGR